MSTRPAAGFVDLVLIEPGVYFRVFELDYQAEQFEVFHRTGLTRWVHYVGTQLIVAAFLSLAWDVRLGPVSAAWLVGALLSAWYLRMDRVVGGVATLQVGVLAALVAVLRPVLSPDVTTTWLVLGIAALAQNLSHSVEPVPPTLTGRGFEPFVEFWPRATLGERVRLIALNGLYLPLELVSAPRLFAVHVLRAMQRFGFRRDAADDVVRRADAILRGT